MLSVLIRFILSTLGAFMILIGGVFSLIGLFIFTLMVCWFLISFFRYENIDKEIKFMSNSDFILKYGVLFRSILAFFGGYCLAKDGLIFILGIVSIVFALIVLIFEYRTKFKNSN